MMEQQFEDIKILNIDGVPYAVDGLSENIQRLVAIFNEWSRKELSVKEELMMVQAAKNDLSRTIIAEFKKEREEGETEAANEEAPTEEQVEEVQNDVSDSEEE